MRDLHICWDFPLRSRPADLWPLISDTDRFNADSGVPSIEQLEQSDYRRRLRLSRLGVTVEWDEEPFEWLRPERFGVVRRYRSGPLAEMRVLAELEDRPSRLRYQVWARPRNWLGRALVRLQLIESGYRFAKTVRAYDAVAAGKAPEIPVSASARLAPGGANRIERVRRELVEQGMDEVLVSRLCRLVEHAPDLDLHRLRPYALADAWGIDRRKMLELCLRATRAGMFEFQWELLCPLCRGSKQRAPELGDVEPRVHCDACKIDFQVSFDRSVELTFRPSATIREIQIHDYCVGGPQKTPHIVLQQVLDPRERRTVQPALEPGVYRFRRWGDTTGRILRASPTAGSPALLDGEPGPDLVVSTRPELALENRSDETRLVVLERFAWSDQAVTAADVTALQIFRDLFASEALRPGLPLTVASLTVMFTDLVDSGRLYRDLGDAVAFGRILQQQKVVTEAVEAEGGAIVKTIGDRTMAVFRRPAAALRSALDVQRSLASPIDPLRLKVGIHTGSSIAVTLNDKLDYFGMTVNVAAKLTGLSTGNDVIASEASLQDPEVETWLLSEAVVREPLPSANAYRLRSR